MLSDLYTGTAPQQLALGTSHIGCEVAVIGRKEYCVRFKVPKQPGVSQTVRVMTYMYVLSHGLTSKIILRCRLAEGKWNSIKCLIKLKEVKEPNNIDTSN